MSKPVAIYCTTWLIVIALSAALLTGRPRR